MDYPDRIAYTLAAVSDVRVAAAVPEDLDQALDLYRAVGWSAYTSKPETLRIALQGSSCVMVARDGATLVGLARVISDGASIAYLQDVLVHPDYRRRGIGAALVRAALAPYEAVRQKVLLTDDEPAQQAFYERLGYHEISTFDDGSLRAFVRFD